MNDMRKSKTMNDMRKSNIMNDMRKSNYEWYEKIELWMIWENRIMYEQWTYVFLMKIMNK